MKTKLAIVATAVLAILITTTTATSVQAQSEMPIRTTMLGKLGGKRARTTT
jgi:hypothetical protein